MVQQSIPVISNLEVAAGVFEVVLRSKEIAAIVQPGQFINIRAMDGSWGPLLRRPFSVSRVNGDEFSLLFNIVGTGTKILAGKRMGDMVDVLGPLGKPFGVDGDFETALLVGGGLGVAPFPMLTEHLLRKKNVHSFIGARTNSQLYIAHLQNVNAATDDGSEGFHGTNVSLLEVFLKRHEVAKPKIFACGPTPMLKAVSELAQRLDLPCEISLEGDMACGVGICQGCPVARVTGPKKYALVCTEGPTFECREVAL